MQRGQCLRPGRPRKQRDLPHPLARPSQELLPQEVEEEASHKRRLPLRRRRCRLQDHPDHREDLEEARRLRDQRLRLDHPEDREDRLKALLLDLRITPPITSQPTPRPLPGTPNTGPP